MAEQGTNELRLQVASAKERDMGKGVARVSKEVFSRLGLEPGRVIEIVGKSSTAAIALPPYPATRGWTSSASTACNAPTPTSRSATMSPSARRTSSPPSA